MVQRYSARPGFTLTELLVVIGILAILLAIIFPVVTSMRSAADAVRCVSNLRQCAQAHLAYAANNRGEIPHTTRQIKNDVTSTTQIPWMVAIADYYERTAESTNTANIDKTAACPSYKKYAWPVLNYNGGTLYSNWGYVRNCYLYQNGETNVLPQPGLTAGNQRGDWCQKGWCEPFRLQKITFPSTRFLIGDGSNGEHHPIRVNSTFTYNRNSPTNGQGVLAYQYAYLLPAGSVAGVAGVPNAMVNDAHRGKRSYAMCDGSVRRLNDSAMDNSNEFWLSIMDPGRL